MRLHPHSPSIPTFVFFPCHAMACVHCFRLPASFANIFIYFFSARCDIISSFPIRSSCASLLFGPPRKHLPCSSPPPEKYDGEALDTHKLGASVQPMSTFTVPDLISRPSERTESKTWIFLTKDEDSLANILWKITLELGLHESGRHQGTHPSFLCSNENEFLHDDAHLQFKMLLKFSCCFSVLVAS